MNTAFSKASMALVLVSIGLTTACSSSSGAGNSNPPPPATTTPACVISADCPAGSHCDLEQCVQDCNTTDPCTGELTCTPRARCAPPGAPDVEPAPSTTHAGDLSVSPSSVALMTTDTSFTVTLNSNASTPVRYRLALSGPHLSVADGQDQGTFTGSTTITVNVDPTKAQGSQADIPGSLKVISSLGDMVINAPLHAAGVTGSYKGVLSFDGGPVSLGHATLALDIIEQHGDVKARVDSTHSLLFPTTSENPTTGYGTYTDADGIDVTLAQIVDQTVGADRNHFGRPLGHKLHMKLKPGAGRTLTGTFQDQTFGLFPEPTTMTGTVSLSLQATGTAPSFDLGPDLQMPANPSAQSAPDPFAIFGWPAGQCAAAMKASCAAGTDCYEYATPLATTMQHRLTTSAPISDVADACRTAMKTTSLTDWTNKATGCSSPQMLACGLSASVLIPASNSQNAQLMGSLTREMLAAPLLVAKDEMVTATNQSFAMGLAAEAQHVTNAQQALSAPLAWMLSPAMIESLRSMNPSDAADGTAPPPGSSTTNDTFPAGRALADLLSTSAAVDAESTRVNAALSGGSTSAVTEQGRALVAYFEMAALSEILTQWKTVPPTIASTFNNVLGTRDRAFSAALEGATVFGVPQGFVPFVFRQEDASKGATNFEQMLSVAQQSISAEASLEAPFLANLRTYENSAQAMQVQLSQLRSQYDAKLTQACGAAFNPDLVKSDADWAACGANNGGDVGAAVLELQKAKDAVHAAQTRMAGMQQKIDIDRTTLATVLGIREDDIAFISQTGNNIDQVIMEQGMLSAAQSAIGVVEGLADGNYMQAGSSALSGAADIGNAALAQQKQDLETTQQMHSAQASSDVEQANGQAQIQKEMIDLAQAGVDIAQESVGAVEAAAKIQDLIGQAKSTYTERQRLMAIIGQDPSLDPSYRILADQQGIALLAARSAAQNELYLAGNALSYELNMSIGNLDGAVLSANNSTSLNALAQCFSGVFNSARIAYGSPQNYVTTVSVRQMLGITGPRTDSVTGETLSEGEQFRLLLLKNENLDGRGGVGIQFATDLQPGNGLWSTDVCNDKLSGVQAQLVGDFLGDNQAQVNVSLGGGAVLRACDGSNTLTPWSMGSSSVDLDAGFAVIQAGVNSFGTAPPNTSLFGQSVARASWKLVVPGGQDAPSNADVDITKIDDIVLNFSHQALPRKSSPLAVDLSCLGAAPGM